MKIKTSEATPIQIDYLVAKCEGVIWAAPDGELLGSARGMNYSTDWSQGGPIIGREGISIIRCDDEYGTDSKGFTTSKRIPVWAATTGQRDHGDVYGSQGDEWGSVYSIDAGDVVYGPTPLTAAMRCYVASKLGDEVEVPDELTS
jgi:hypothetical protein